MAWDADEDRELAIRSHFLALEGCTANEIDFDDERDDDQLPLDQTEAREVGALLDDPENMDLDEIE